MKVLFIKPLPLKYENSNKKFNEIHSVGTIFSIEKNASESGYHIHGHGLFSSFFITNKEFNSCFKQIP